MTRRKIVEIDESRCNGCGLCVPSCAEGAIQIVQGKAKLVSDVYCDGLGACLGTCPQDAIRVVEREAEAFDEEAARRHIEKLKAASATAQPQERTRREDPSRVADRRDARPAPAPAPAHGCPGAAVRAFGPGPAATSTPWRASNGESVPAGAPTSALGNWPVQLRLVPPNAPFLHAADLLLVADCVPFACADFHRRFLQGRPVLIGCPKLDDAAHYVQKLAEAIKLSSIRSITVLHMEVPCCTGLVRIAAAAIADSQRDVPLNDVTISIRGEVLDPASARL